MTCIKGVNRSASVAFSPDSPYLAAGTMAGAVDLSFSSSANLEIFKLDFQSDDQELTVVGDAPSTERFNRLSWGKAGSGTTEEFSLGLIAGGLVDGSINIWNPLSLIRSQDVERSLVGRFQKHTGPVRGLEFNTNSPYLLASGAVEGEICIWDLANPAEPTHFPPLKSVGSGAQGEVSFLSWNHKVHDMLASTSNNGTTVVWDLKQQKPVSSFVDSNRRRCSVLQWNPDVATQLIVASDDDSSPSLRLWDVRNTTSPVKEFVGHTKGVIAMSWCPIDSSFLLTCAKDNRTICWDTISGEIVCELPPGTNWNFDIHWYPKIPGLISASSFDGKIGIYNVEACSRSTAGEADFGGALNMGNGLDFKNYSWTQSIQEATTNVPVPEGTKSRFSVCETEKNRVKIGLKGQPPIVDGELFQSVVDDCFWSTDSLRGLKIPDPPDPPPSPYKESLDDPVFTLFCYDMEDCVMDGSSLEELMPEELAKDPSGSTCVVDDSSCSSHPHLPLLRKSHPLNRRVLACGRRQRIQWGPIEERTLAAAMAEINYETGNWQYIRNKHPEIFALRTAVDLKDKWRTMTGHNVRLKP